MKNGVAPLLLLLLLSVASSSGQSHSHSMPAPASTGEHKEHEPEKLPLIYNVEPQPLLAQAIRLDDALSFLGSSLSADDSRRLKALKDLPHTAELSRLIQEILDPYCLAMININPEARVKVISGSAKATLTQGGWSSFLVKVHNESGVNARLQVESPNADFPFKAESAAHQTAERDKLSAGQVADRFLEMQLYANPPLKPNLSGLSLEYAVLQAYSKDAGKREAEIGFNIGHGTQDIGFRNTIPVLFDIRPSVKVVLRVKDTDGSPAMASFTITDGVERILIDTADNNASVDFRLRAAREDRLYSTSAAYGAPKFFKTPTALRGIYPLPSRRVAAYDEYPDFFFQPQVYREDGEHVWLAPGRYQVKFTRGPEYITQEKELVVPDGVDAIEVPFQLKRWINMASLGWYSADHHVHASGCSHYYSPEEGVRPLDMWRQVVGEDLNVAGVLTWGPSWYHQKKMFTGESNPLSTSRNVMRYDVEVSGFPSSHAGHLVLLKLKEDDYPGTTKVEEWPSWTLPVLKWAKDQGSVTGYAHSGWGLEPTIGTNELPNLVLPKMDGIGAVEYVVAVTQGLVDIYSAGNTVAPWELNMWYHSLNCGYTTRLSGETDFPCIFDERVGLARSYFKPEGPLNFERYAEEIKKGRSYISDGSSHIIDFSVNGLEMGTKDSKLSLSKPHRVKISAKVSANLPREQDETGAYIAGKKLTDPPFWHPERARIGKQQKVRVELIVNGKPVDTAVVDADGGWKNVQFSYPVQQSSWMALRIYPSAHTNPIFVTVGNKPIVVKESAEWCRKAVDQCWKMKEPRIREAERPAALAAYDEARKVYDRMIRESEGR